MRRYGMKKALFCACFALTIIITSSSVKAQSTLYQSTMDVADKDFEYVEGKVTSSVNVRVDAGASSAKVKVKGKEISLKKGSIVTILSTKMVGSKPWYQVRFILDGQEVEGYATSSYIEKTGVVITPSPIPTKIPEPSPEPTKVAEPSKVVEEEVLEPEPTLVIEDVENKSKGGLTSLYIGITILAIAMVGIGAYVFYRKKKQTDGEEVTNVSSAVDKLKNMVLGERNQGTEEAKEQAKDQVKSDLKDPSKSLAVKPRLASKKHPEIRILKEDKASDKGDLLDRKREVYVVKAQNDSISEEFAVTTESHREDVDSSIEDTPMDLAKESPDKELLRQAIHNLREHDMIIHKYFGKGEVYDNSDVRLIEVRFGLDARFLNKEQLVNKKLIRITKERKR